VQDAKLKRRRNVNSVIICLMIIVLGLKYRKNKLLSKTLSLKEDYLSPIQFRRFNF